MTNSFIVWLCIGHVVCVIAAGTRSPTSNLSPKISTLIHMHADLFMASQQCPNELPDTKRKRRRTKIINSLTTDAMNLEFYIEAEWHDPYSNTLRFRHDYNQTIRQALLSLGMQERGGHDSCLTSGNARCVVWDLHWTEYLLAKRQVTKHSSKHRKDNARRTSKIRRSEESMLPDISYSNTMTKQKGAEFSTTHLERAWKTLPSGTHINMIPGIMDHLCSKDGLARTFKVNWMALGAQSVWFIPPSFTSRDEPSWTNQLINNGSNLWMVKPNNAAEGNGICITTRTHILQGAMTYNRLCPVQYKTLTRGSKAKRQRKTKSRANKLNQLPVLNSVTIQEYVVPMTASPRHGHNSVKWDLRMWVLVTSVEPLRVYVLRDGLVRMATRPFSTANEQMNDVCVHITNGVLQKQCRGVGVSGHAPNTVWDESFLTSLDTIDSTNVTWSFHTAWELMSGAVVQSLQLIKNKLVDKQNALSLKERNVHAFQFLSYDFVLRQSDGEPRLMEVNADGYMKGGLQHIGQHARECTRELLTIASVSSQAVANVAAVSEILSEYCEEISSGSFMSCMTRNLNLDVGELSILGGRCWSRLLLSRVPCLTDVFAWSQADRDSDAFAKWWMQTNTTVH